MKLSLQLPTDRADRVEEFVTGDAVTEMARAAEAAGIDNVAVTEHPFPDDAWMASGGHHALDPFVALSFAAAATRTLGVRTNLLVLPYRNPFLTAKAVASLDALSGGRLVLGVGAGYLEPEFRALGVPFESRNDAVDEALAAMKLAWSQDGVTFRGRDFEATGNTMRPRPVQQPHPPIFVGGNSRRAARRAVEAADGWMPFPNSRQTVARRHTAAIETLDDLRAGVEYAREHARSVGRTAPLQVMFPLGGITVPVSSSGPDALIETARHLASVGVTEVGVGVPRPETRAEFLAGVEGLGRDLVPQLHAITTEEAA